MSAVATPESTRPARQRAIAIPPLQSGDRLTVAEYMRRYEAMPPKTRAELIRGVVYVSSPVSREHAESHPSLVAWLATYQAFTGGVLAGDNATIRLDEDTSQPQPDGHLRIDPKLGGQTRVSAHIYIEGAPELVAEVALTSANYDLHDKLEVYRDNGVREYIVWRVWDDDVDWFVLHAGQFVPLAPGPDGNYRSEVFPGLWLDKTALIRGNLARVLEVVQQGISSPEHAAFVAELSRRAGSQTAE